MVSTLRIDLAGHQGSGCCKRSLPSNIDGYAYMLVGRTDVLTRDVVVLADALKASCFVVLVWSGASCRKSERLVSVLAASAHE